MDVTLYQAKLTFVPAQPIYELHCDLSRVLGKRDKSACLYRTDVDRNARPVKRIVLVQSRAPGDWNVLREASQRGAQLIGCAMKERALKLAAGQRYRFFLRANAVQAKKASLRELADVRGDAFRAARGKRTAIRGETALRSWLARQAERCGFTVETTEFWDDNGATASVPSVRISISPGRDVAWRSKGRRGEHAGTDFEGILRVVDADKLATALQAGIGPAKAFGFGLLTLARIS
jgi:CRISPR system Cascade subunit CasE